MNPKGLFGLVSRGPGNFLIVANRWYLGPDKLVLSVTTFLLLFCLLTFCFVTSSFTVTRIVVFLLGSAAGYSLYQCASSDPGIVQLLGSSRRLSSSSVDRTVVVVCDDTDVSATTTAGERKMITRCGGGVRDCEHSFQKKNVAVPSSTTMELVRELELQERAAAAAAANANAVGGIVEVRRSQDELDASPSLSQPQPVSAVDEQEQEGDLKSLRPPLAQEASSPSSPLERTRRATPPPSLSPTATTTTATTTTTLAATVRLDETILHEGREMELVEVDSPPLPPQQQRYPISSTTTTTIRALHQTHSEQQQQLPSSCSMMDTSFPTDAEMSASPPQHSASSPHETEWVEQVFLSDLPRHHPCRRRRRAGGLYRASFEGVDLDDENSDVSHGTISNMMVAGPTTTTTTVAPVRPRTIRLPLKWCYVCNHRRPLRSVHCRFCNVCIARRDHHCPWTGTCIGKRNYRWYLLFLCFTFVVAWLLVGASVMSIGDRYNRIEQEVLQQQRQQKQQRSGAVVITSCTGSGNASFSSPSSPGGGMGFLPLNETHSSFAFSCESRSNHSSNNISSSSTADGPILWRALTDSRLLELIHILSALFAILLTGSLLQYHFYLISHDMTTGEEEKIDASQILDVEDEGVGGGRKKVSDVHPFDRGDRWENMKASLGLLRDDEDDCPPHV